MNEKIDENVEMGLREKKEWFLEIYLDKKFAKVRARKIVFIVVSLAKC